MDFAALKFKGRELFIHDNLSSMKGWIALDIDGTITQDKYSVPAPVAELLKDAHNDGWKLAFATGRAFVFASPALSNFDFPFVLLAQNGSIAIDMPSKEILFRKYLHSSLLTHLEGAVEDLNTDFLVYSGFENKDRCYYRPSRFSKDDQAYLEEIRKRENETWYPVQEFPLDFHIPLVKYFGPFDVMTKISSRLKSLGFFQVSLIRDPFHEHYYVLLVTDKQASKGASLRELLALKGREGIVVAAGDDENDISLLQAADVKIAMPHAPESLRKIADFVAPPVAELGIIQALKIVMINANRKLKKTDKSD